MRSDHQTQSFHFFHTYAVRDRIDLSEFSDDDRSPEVCKAEHVLPSTDGKKQSIDNYIHLCIHILMKYCPYFKKLGIGMQRYIPHKYYSEMSHKSEVVS